MTEPLKPYKHKSAKIYPRIDWSGHCEWPRGEVRMVHPIKKVMFHFNTDIDVCTNWIDCLHTMQVLQKRHMLEGSDDIKFNFLIGGDGQGYEGRGFDYKPCPSLRSLYTYPRPIKGHEDWERMDVAVIGRYTCYDDLPVPIQLGMHDVVNIGVQKGLVQEFYSYYEIRDEKPPEEIAGYNKELPPTMVIMTLHKPEDIVEKFEIFTREEWGALPPKKFEALTNPSERIIFTYDLNIDECKTNEECGEAVRELQRRHMGEGSDDIKYNFLIGGDYNVYEGRGWSTRPCKSLKYFAYRHKRTDVGFIGRFEAHEYVPIRMTLIAFELMRIGERSKYLEDPVRLNEIVGPPTYGNIVFPVQTER